MPAPIRVYVYTLGCPKNDADSRRLTRRLSERGVELAHAPDEATHLLINTCGFTQDAKEESIEAILDAVSGYPDMALLVMGCLVQRYRQELEAGLPEVTAWYGLQDTDRLVADLGAHHSSLDADSSPPTDARTGGASTTETGPSASYGYVKISDGCDHACTFCAIPGIKGPYRALPLRDIEEQSAGYLAEGARELVMVGQDTALWSDEGLTLADLVGHLADDERVAWIRLMYMQPENVDDGILRMLAEHPKACRYLDIPFQHARREVLARMGRRGDADTHLALLARARALMPDVSLRSTFIVGFPGETEKDFSLLLDFVREARFDHAGAFIFSPEEETTAARLRPRVPRKVAVERYNRLSIALEEAAEAAAWARVGSVVEVLLESLDPDGDWPEATVAQGRTRGQAPEVDGRTFVDGPLPPFARVGRLVRAVVTDAIGYDLVAEWHVAP